jgi:general stress protein CsbA
MQQGQCHPLPAKPCHGHKIDTMMPLLGVRAILYRMYSTVQFSSVLHTLQYTFRSTVHYSRYSVVQYITVQRTVKNSTEQYFAVLYSTVLTCILLILKFDFNRAVSALLLSVRLLSSGLLKRYRKSVWIILSGTECDIALNRKLILQT